MKHCVCVCEFDSIIDDDGDGFFLLNLLNFFLFK